MRTQRTRVPCRCSLGEAFDHPGDGERVTAAAAVSLGDAGTQQPDLATEAPLGLAEVGHAGTFLGGRVDALLRELPRLFVEPVLFRGRGELHLVCDARERYLT